MEPGKKIHLIVPSSVCLLMCSCPMLDFSLTGMETSLMEWYSDLQCSPSAISFIGHQIPLSCLVVLFLLNILLKLNKKTNYIFLEFWSGSLSPAKTKHIRKKLPSSHFLWSCLSHLRNKTVRGAVQNKPRPRSVILLSDWYLLVLLHLVLLKFLLNVPYLTAQFP